MKIWIFWFIFLKILNVGWVWFVILLLLKILLLEFVIIVGLLINVLVFIVMSKWGDFVVLFVGFLVIIWIEYLLFFNVLLNW